MKHFLGLIIFVFGGLSLLYLYREDQQNVASTASLKVFASSSFIGSWGPGPELKDIFEKQTGLKISFIEMGETSLAMQKLAQDGTNSVADVFLGLDQFDLVRHADQVRWLSYKPAIDFQWPTKLSEWSDNEFFTPYNYAPISFVVRSTFKTQVNQLNDLLKPELTGKISLQDPRTSSPGLQLLFWIMRTQPEASAIEFLKALRQQAHSFSNSWSASYGLFREKQSEMVLSYATSPIYHLIEDKDSNYRSLELNEGHPVQVEFVGIPETCRNCEAAKRFVSFLMSATAQKVIMNKNYMLPVNPVVQEGSPFESIKVTKDLRPYRSNANPARATKTELQNWLNLWSEIARSESQ